MHFDEANINPIRIKSYMCVLLWGGGREGHDTFIRPSAWLKTIHFFSSLSLNLTLPPETNHGIHFTDHGI